MVKDKQAPIEDGIRMDLPLGTTADALATDVEDQTVLVNLITGYFYETNASGGVIWSLVEEGLTTNEIVKALLKRYSASEEQCRNEVCDFIENMVEFGFVEYRKR